jgi:5-methylcytosine-specific restriction endonuclease McrA
MAQLRRLFRRRGRPPQQPNPGGKGTTFYQLWRAFRCECAYCWKSLPFHEATRDHVVPRAHGGGQRGNIVPACRACNSDKGDKTLRAWLAVAAGPNREAVLVRIRLTLARWR